MALARKTSTMAYLTLLGITAACLTTTAFVPQVLKVWRTRSTGDISLAMFSMTFIGIVMWFIYGLLLVNIPLILANAVTMVLVGSIVVAKIRFG